jgi:Anti-sigma-K factor rskA
VPHVDAELLALHALGESLPTDAAHHLAGCATCEAEIASLRQVVGLGRSLGGDDVLVPPPDSAWLQIAAETGVDPATLRYVELAPAADTPPLPPQRRTWWALAAAAAGILVGAAAVVGWQTLDDDGAAAVASAVLDPLADPDATGTATVNEIDGRRELSVDLDAESGQDAYLEVWLLSPDASQLVSLGVMHGESGTFSVPDGLDLAAFPVVDVSVEPLDGDPAHSGDSVVRGTLDQA